MTAIIITGEVKHMSSCPTSVSVGSHILVDQVVYVMCLKNIQRKSNTTTINFSNF